MGIKRTIRHIANELGEFRSRPCTQIRRILTFLGEEATFALLAEARRIECEGCMRVRREGLRTTSSRLPNELPPIARETIWFEHRHRSS
jgi:hypothetical protein